MANILSRELINGRNELETYYCPTAYKKINTWLGKRPLITKGRLTNLELTSLVK